MLVCARDDSCVILKLGEEDKGEGNEGERGQAGEEGLSGGGEGVGRGEEGERGEGERTRSLDIHCEAEISKVKELLFLD